MLVRGTHLLRSATSGDDGRTVALTGDNGTDPDIEVFTSAAAVTWNGEAVHTQAHAHRQPDRRRSRRPHRSRCPR